jgi:cytochrome c biogenesis protein CcdA
VHNDLLELLGALLVVAFFAVVWWPAALLVAGVLLILAAWIRERTAPAEPAPTEEST